MALRLLFCFAGGRGHLDPLVPLARAAEAAGHDVAFSGRPWMTPQVEALGFRAFAAGTDAGLAPARRPLVRRDVEREMRAVGPGFGLRVARSRAADLDALAWRPDVFVCEELDWGAMIAAERRGVPHATVLVTATGSFVRPEWVAESVDAVRRELGLAPDPDLAMPSRHLVLSPFPPSLRDPAGPIVPTFRSIAPAPARRTDPPTVSFTLGTVFNVECGDLYARVLAGLRDLPIRVVATVGRDVDPAELGPQPANVRVEQYVPQAELLPQCALAVSHAGSGSVLGALAHGLPMVLLPLGADQPQNAARCHALGVARVLDAIDATPAQIGEAVAALLVSERHRHAAERLRDELAALPDPTEAVRRIEQLASYSA